MQDLFRVLHRALCFSPKGKQLCVGHADGSLSQLKLDLAIAKRIPGLAGIPFSILWVSTTQFLVTVTVNGDCLGNSAQCSFS